MESSDQPRDVRDLPNYTAAESAGWLAVPYSTLRQWLVGLRSGAQRMDRVVAPAKDRPLLLSFWNLVECSVISSVRKEHGVSLQKLRAALEFVGKTLGVDRPLINKVFHTDGVHIFVEHLGQLVSASERGQIGMRDALDASLKRIVPDEQGLAARLLAAGRRPNSPDIVSVDPFVSFGRPVLIGTGVPIEIVAERFNAGDSIAHLVKEFHLSQELVEEALRWCDVGKAAA